MTTRARNGTQQQTTVSCTFAYSGTTHVLPIDQDVRVLTFNDAPAVSPLSGEAAVKSRSHHNVASFKDFTNAFAGERDRRFEQRGGVVRELAASTMTTNFPSGIWFAPAENTPSMPTDTGSSIVAGAPGVQGGTRPAAITAGSRNPHHPAFFAGTTNSGVFVGRIDDEGSGPDNCQTGFLRWTGSAWTEEAAPIATNAREDSAVFDFTTHKDTIVVAVQSSGGALTVYSSSNGDTFAAYSNIPGSAAGAGTRLVDDGGTLYAFRTTAAGNSFAVLSTADEGGTAWSSVISSFSGRLRDVGRFYDRDGNDRIVVLTEDALYWFDTANSLLERLLSLPLPGRGIEPWGDELLIFMDGGRVLSYKATGAVRDVSPDLGTIGEFGQDTSGQICLATGLLGVYALWSGTDEAGSAQKPLCLLYDGVGWHFVWQKADTSISGAARFIFVDPISGDLVFGVQDAISEDTSLFRLKDIELDPAIQSTLDRQTAGVLTFARQDFGSPIVPTLLLDMFIHSSGLGASKSIAPAYRINGSTGAYTTAATITTDNSRVTFPANVASDLGVSFRDAQIQLTCAANAATDVIRFLSFDVGYDRIWPVRYVYVIDVKVKEQAGPNMPPPETVWASCDTIQSALTKGVLVFGNQTKYVQPIPDSSATQTINSLANQHGTPRTGTRRMAFLES